MSLIPNLNDIPELGPVEEAEYDLRVTKSMVKTAKSTGRKAINLCIEIVGEENAEPLWHSIWLPMESDDPGKAATMLRMLKDFMSAVGLPTDGDTDETIFEDLEFSALLIQVPHYADEDKMVNEIKRVM